MLPILLTLILSNNLVSALSPVREKCIRCICNAVSACWELKLCANKTINEKYWREANPTVNNPVLDPMGFSKCVQDDGCILDTIDQYTRKTVEFTNDVNCDGTVDCRDHLAVHKYGKEVKEPRDKVFTVAETKRFDLCMGGDGPNLTKSGWEPKICVGPRTGSN